MAQTGMYYNELIMPNFQIRNYLQGRLYKKLATNRRYCLSFYISLADGSGYAIKEVAAYLDNGSIDTTKACSSPLIQFHPQIINAIGIVSDTLNWIKIEGTFIANGNESFITIGNFNNKAGTTILAMPIDSQFESSAWRYAIYLVDDVSVIESDLPAYAGPDKHVGKGDSVYIGRPKEVGLECTWSALGSTAIIGTGAGIWVKPAVTTSYVVTQTLCGTVKKDTVRVEVWAAGVHSVNGQAQQYMLSPNPGNGIIQLSQTAIDVLPVSLSVHESSGRQVYSGSISFHDGQASLDAAGLSPGFYILQLRDGHGNAYALRYVRQ
jgi:hypothetical protein